MKSTLAEATESLLVVKGGFRCEEVLVEGVNVSKVFQTLGKKIWEGDTDRQDRVSKWLADRVNQIRDNKGVIAFAKVAANLGLDTDQENHLYDALIWADETNGAKDSPASKEELRSLASNISAETKAKQDAKVASLESKTPILTWKRNKATYNAYRVKTSDTLFKMARWGELMKPSPGNSPEDEATHNTTWCVRFPDYATKYLKHGDALVITKNGKAYVAMFDTLSQDCPNTFVDASNEPVMGNSALMEEIQPFLSKFHFQSMTEKQLSKKINSQSTPDDLLKYMGNYRERAVRKIEVPILEKMNPDQIASYAQLISNIGLMRLSKGEIDSLGSRAAQDYESFKKFIWAVNVYPGGIPKETEEKWMKEDSKRALEIMNAIANDRSETANRFRGEWQKSTDIDFESWTKLFVNRPDDDKPPFYQSVVNHIVADKDARRAAMYYAATYKDATDPERKIMIKAFAPLIKKSGTEKYLDYGDTYLPRSIQQQKNGAKEYLLSIMPDEWQEKTQ